MVVVITCGSPANNSTKVGLVLWSSLSAIIASFRNIPFLKLIIQPVSLVGVSDNALVEES